MAEQWKDIDGYEGLYQVSDQGRVKSFHYDKVHGRPLKPCGNGTGYLMVALYRDGKQTRLLVHRLVAEAHLGKAPPGCECNHKNGDKADNRVENLGWVTASENQKHSYRVLGRRPPGLKGEAAGRSKLTERQVKEIRKLYATGKHTQTELGEMFGVDPSIICRIVNHKLWQHVS